MIIFEPKYIYYKGEEIERVGDGYMYELCFWPDIEFLVKYIDFKEKYIQMQAFEQVLNSNEHKA